jgi:hypothetical protein
VNRGRKKAEPKLSGGFMASAMEEPPAGLDRDDRMVTVLLMMNTNRWIRDEGLRLEDTPSRGRFIKEPLEFFIIEPAVLSAIS